MVHLARSNQHSPNILPFSAAGLADVISSPFTAAFNYSASHWPVAGLVVASAAKSRDAPSVFLSKLLFLPEFESKIQNRPLTRSDSYWTDICQFSSLLTM